MFDLINASPEYRKLSVGEIYDSIIAAHAHHKMFVWTDNGNMVGLMTFAFIPDDKVQAFLQGEYKVQNDDFACNNGELWVMDFIAPFGSVLSMMRQAQHKFAELYGDGTEVRWKRSKRVPFKTGYAVARKQFDVAA